MCTREIKSRTVTKKQYSVGSRIFSPATEFKFREETIKVLHLERSPVWYWNMDTGRVDQKYLERFEMRCWRRMEKNILTNRVRNEEVLHRDKEDGNILHATKRRNANWIGHILHRNCLLKQIIEGNVEERIEVKIIQGTRRKQLLDHLKETRGYWKLKEEALHYLLWKTRFGRR